VARSAANRGVARFLFVRPPCGLAFACNAPVGAWLKAMRTILVTGGAGFIGSNVVAALAQNGERVIVCDRLRSDEKWRNLAKHDFDDLIAPERVLDWLAQSAAVDAVIHLGAISSTTVTDGDLVYDVNVRFSTALWDACATRRIPFLYASSAATYGNGHAGFDDAAGPDFLAKLHPLNAYGWSKHVFDRRVARLVAHGSASPPQWVGLKFFNVYGPNEYHKGAMQSVVAQKYPLVAADLPVTLFKSHHPDYPDGGQLRDFIYVDDCVDVLLWLLEHPNVSGLLNLGTGRARSFADLARAIAAALGKSAIIEYVPTPEAIRANYQYFTEARMDRLRAAGYQRPFTSLEEGVRRYVHNHLSKLDRYR
jgi:ADP-L-glycero-D-manno-heptose 6-epimerase